MKLQRRSFLFYVLIILAIAVSWFTYQLLHLNRTNNNSKIIATPQSFNDTLVFFISEIPKTFNPFSSVYDEDIFLLKQLYRGFTKINSNLIEVPDLAEYWDISADRLTYTFHLRKNLFFHDKSPITIDDFISSVEYYFKNYSRNYSIAYFRIIKGVEDYLANKSDSIEGIKKISDNIVQITLNRPYVPFPKLLSLPQMRILPKKYLNANSQKLLSHPVGNGPYRLLKKTNQYMIFEASTNNDIYEPWVKYYKFQAIRTKTNKRNENYLSQNFDLTIHPTDEFFEKPEFLLYRNVSTFSMVFLGMNCKKPPTNSDSLRKAIYYGYDSKEVLEKYQNFSKPTEFFSPVLIPMDSIEKTLISIDLDRAKSYLDSTEFEKGIGTITMIVDTIDYSPIYAKSLQDLGDSLHFSVNNIFLSGMDMQFRHKILNQANVFVFDWQLDLPVPDFFFNLLFKSNSPMNLFNYANDQVDSLLELAKFEENSTRRNELYAAAEQLIIRDAPMRPVIYYRDFVFYKDYIKGALLSRLGIASLELDKIYIDTLLYQQHNWKN
jgi:oligopeptide transport system substrate-binding protein